MTVLIPSYSTLYFFGYKTDDLTGTERRSRKGAFAAQCES